MIDKNAAVPLVEDHVPEVREPAGYRHSDASIHEEVRRQLDQDDGLDARGVVVAVRDGEVTISGRVSRCTDVQRAEQHACATEGVKLVRNGLTSDQPPPPVDATTRPEGPASRMGKPGYER